MLHFASIGPHSFGYTLLYIKENLPFHLSSSENPNDIFIRESFPYRKNCHHFFFLGCS